MTETLKRAAREQGFGLVGVCPAVSPAGVHRLRDWLAAGYAGEMRYLEDRLEAYAHPSSVLDGVQSMMMLGMHYRTQESAAVVPGQGRVARYAWGQADYHDIIHRRLRQMKGLLLTQRPGAMVRGVVDTAPLLEREFAQLAGLGWIGKNTMLINKWTGSWFFLAALLTDQSLDYDAPHQADHCGTCRACLDACPTAAFPEPYVLDATRCISYWTIEQPGLTDAKDRDKTGDWLFGCDICQEVCPWNHRAPQSDEAAYHSLAELNPVSLYELFELDEPAFRIRFRKSPMWRPKRRGMLRNAAMVLGSQQDRAAVGALGRGLQDEEPLVRSACAWALGNIGGSQAHELLSQRTGIEQDELVRQELERGIQRPRDT